MSNVIFRKVSLSNFMSFGKGPSTIRLDEGKVTLVRGENRDIGTVGDSLNGAGKSTFMQAIIYAIYGVGIESKMKSDGYINLKNGKKLLVELEFSIGKDEYRIVRGRKPTFLEFYKNEESLTRDSMDNTTETIIEVIGVPYDVFIRTYFASPHVEPFMAMTTANQRNLMESILSLDVLAFRAESLSKIIRKDIQAEMKVIEQDLNNANANNAKVEENILELSLKCNSWNDEREAEINRLTSQINDLDPGTDEHIELLENAEVIKKEVQVLEKELSDIGIRIKSKTIDLDSLKSSIEERDTLKEKAAKYRETLEASRKELIEKLEALASEEECRSSIEAKTLADEAISEAKACSAKAEKRLESAERELDRIDKLVAEISSLESGVCPYCSQKHFDREKVATLKKEVDEREKTVSSLTEEIEELERNENELKAKANALLKSVTVENPESVQKERHSLEAKIAGLSDVNPYQERLEALGDVKTLLDEYRALEDEIKVIFDYKRNLEGEIKKKQEEINQITASVPFRSVEEIKKVRQVIDTLNSNIEKEKKLRTNNPYPAELARMNAMLIETIELEEKYKQKEVELEHVGYLIKLLTDPKSFIRKGILDLYVPFLNKKINTYTEDFGLPHIVEVNSDLSVDIQYMGKDVTYHNLSQGERVRLNMATTLAFRDLLSLLGKSSNLFLVDEYMDAAVDPSGINDMMRRIRDFSDDVFVISHRQEFAELSDRTLKVVKQDGFSDLDWS